VWFGERITRLVPLTWVHRISATVFVVLGLLILFGGDAPDANHNTLDYKAQITQLSDVQHWCATKLLRCPCSGLTALISAG
jgi:hypothetical protein